MCIRSVLMLGDIMMQTCNEYLDIGLHFVIASWMACSGREAFYTEELA